MLPYDLLLDMPEASATPTREHHPAIDIWWWPHTTGQTDWVKIKSRLTREEQDRAAAFRFEKDSIGFMAGRYLQRSILSSYTGIAAEDLHIAVGEHGKPYLADKTALTFNLSNTEGLSILAISRDCTVVGIDAEIHSTLLEEETAQLICSASELATLSALQGAERQSLLLTYWTLKESFLKATGEGLIVDPNRLNVWLEHGTKTIHIEQNLSSDDTGWHHRLFRSPVGHLIAVSAQSERAALAFRQHRFPDQI